MNSITPSASGYVYKKMVYGEFVVSLVRQTWESDCIVSMIVAGNAVQEVRFKTSLTTAVNQYEMFCEMAKTIADYYGRTSLYLRRQDNVSFALMKGYRNAHY